MRDFLDQNHCQNISRGFIKDLRDAGFWVEEESQRGHHLFGIRFPKGFALEEVKARIKKKKIAISFRGDSMRVAPHVYNDTSDFKRLFNAIK